MSTGQMFFAAGAVGAMISVLAAIILLCALHKKEKNIKAQIWREYK